MTKNVLYIDMDGVLVDFKRGVEAHPEKKKYKGKEDMIPGIFSKLKPMPGAIKAFKELFEKFDVYILSTPPWDNPDAWVDKRNWVEKHLPEAKRRLILTHHKNLNKGDVLIDDSNSRGQDQFVGEWIHFGKAKFPNWKTILQYLNNKLGSDGGRGGQGSLVDYREGLRDDYVLDN